MIHPLPHQFTDRPIRIAVAGAGGTGSQVLSGLARMHIALQALGHEGLDVCAFDPDLVTEANVGRQLFSPSDLGANKAAVLVNRLNCFFNLDWHASPTRYKAGQRWSDETADFLIGCVDSAAARRELAATRFRYWLDIGNTAKKGQVILGTRLAPKSINRLEQELIKKGADPSSGSARASRAVSDAPSDTPRAPSPVSPGAQADLNIQLAKSRDAHKRLGSKYAFAYTPPRPRLVTEIFPELKNKRLKEDNAPSCSLAEALEHQDLFINQTVATFALQLLWQFIRHGGLDIHGYFINLETGKVTPLPITEPVAPAPVAPVAPAVAPSRRRKFRGKVQLGGYRELSALRAALKRPPKRKHK